MDIGCVGKAMQRWARRRTVACRSRAHEPGVERARDGDVRCALNDGAAVGEDGDGVRASAKAEQQIVGAQVGDLFIGGEARTHGGEVHGPVMFVDLD